jgi:hypothetical protein
MLASYHKAWVQMVKMGYTKPEGWDKVHLQEPCLNQPPKCKKHLGKTVSSHPPKTAKRVSSDPPKTVNTMTSFKNKRSTRQFMMLSKYDGNIKLHNLKLNNGQVVKDVSGLYEVISIHNLKKWQGYEATVKKIESHLDGKKYVGTVMGKKLLASAPVHAPMLSGRSAEIVILCIIRSFCEDASIPFDAEQVAKSSTKSGVLSNILKRNGVDTIHALRGYDLYMPVTKETATKESMHL